uniref:Uncharacterized protein n=1 Tax=Lactuca sativa TaxID=4236 RepID=A0A9R1VAX7_LACSA|nr:hypothetical protein LSAT_V11C500256350 [Lactuca sativa]
MKNCFEFSCRYTNMLPIVNESSLDMMYYLAKNDKNYQGLICVEIEKYELIHNCEVRFALPSNDRFEENNEFVFDESNVECSSESLSCIGDNS